MLPNASSKSWFAWFSRQLTEDGAALKAEAEAADQWAGDEIYRRRWATWAFHGSPTRLLRVRGQAVSGCCLAKVPRATGLRRAICDQQRIA